MQRKKSQIKDNPLGCLPHNYNQLFNQHTINASNVQQNHQNFFMKYASSIIQVVNEDKLQKSSKNGAQGEQKSIIYDVSQVNHYEMETLPKSSQYKTVQSNNYNTFGQGFKKKKNKKHILTYNFTNITLFITHISKIRTNILKNGFSKLKSAPNKSKLTNNQPPKSKSSFHSAYTACTANEDQGVKKLTNFYLQLKKNQSAKESINMIKGWVQFRLLINKSQAFRKVKQFSNFKEIEERQGKIKQSFQTPLSSLANQESFFLVNQDEQSLVYTADQNFQFSQKEITVSTPQKPSIQQKFNLFTLNRQQKVSISRYSPPNNYQSQVEVYKLSQTEPNNLYQKEKLRVNQAHPIFFDLLNNRKNYTMRTNTFELPLISQFYLKDEQIPKQNQVPLKKDIFVPNQNEMSCSNEQITKQFQLCKSLFYKQANSDQQSKSKSKINIVQTKSSQHIAQVVKNIKMTQINTQKSVQKLQMRNLDQQKRGLHRVEGYYFPGAQSRIDRLIQTKSRIKIIGDNIKHSQSEKINQQPTLHQQSNLMSKNVRMQESVVRNYPFQSQSRISRGFDIQKDVMLKSQQKKMSSNLPSQHRADNKLKPKISVGFNSPQHKTITSPQNFNLNSLGNNQIKRKPYFSPPSTLKHFENPLEYPKNHINSKPCVQQEYNQTRPLQQPVRLSNKDKEIPIQNNIYQLNFPNQQQKTVSSNLANYYHKIDKKSPSSKQVIVTSANCRVVQQNYVNRPSSKIASTPINHSNIPTNTDHLQYGLPISRASSNKKVSFHSPQTNPNNNPQIMFTQEAKLQQQVLSSRRQDYNHQYFKRENQINKSEEKTINFNNKYYTSGVTFSSRPNQILSPMVTQTKPYPESNSRRTFGNQRPHSSFRSSTDRFNIFSNYSPMESQIQNHIQHSNNFSQRNSSQIRRPKSMNQKIHVTMRRQR